MTSEFFHSYAYCHAIYARILLLLSLSGLLTSNLGRTTHYFFLFHIMIVFGYFFEILAIDKKTAPIGLGLPSFDLPDIDYSDAIVNGALWLTVFLAFFMLSRMVFHIYKLAMAGADDENRETAKDNIKKNFGLFLVSSMLWIALSYFQQGVLWFF